MLGEGAEGTLPILTALSLRANRIGKPAAAALGTAAARVPSLVHLDLSVNPLGDEGIARLVLGEPPSPFQAHAGDHTGGGAGDGETGAEASAVAAAAVGPEDSADGIAEGAAASRRRGRRGRLGLGADAEDARRSGRAGLQTSRSLKTLMLSKVGRGACIVPARLPPLRVPSQHPPMAWRLIGFHTTSKLLPGAPCDRDDRRWGWAPRHCQRSACSCVPST